MIETPTIAIVDDDDGVRTSLASLVRSLGYAVRVYPSATAFLEDAEADDPACMISDIQMPQMSGDQLQAELVAKGRSFPMIFMTAFPSEAIRGKVLDAGALGFLEKPADADVIARWLGSIVETPAG